MAEFSGNREFRDSYDEILRQVWLEYFEDNTTLALNRIAQLVEAADIRGEMWATALLAEASRRRFNHDYDHFVKTQTAALVLPVFDAQGTVHRVKSSAVVGAKQTNLDTGVQEHLQIAIVRMTREQAYARFQEDLKGKTLADHTARKSESVIRLLEKVPEAAIVQDALDSLGLDLQDWLDADLGDQDLDDTGDA